MKIFSMKFGHAPPMYTIGLAFHEWFLYEILTSYWFAKVFSLECFSLYSKLVLLEGETMCKRIILYNVGACIQYWSEVDMQQVVRVCVCVVGIIRICMLCTYAPKVLFVVVGPSPSPSPSHDEVELGCLSAASYLQTQDERSWQLHQSPGLHCYQDWACSR